MMRTTLETAVWISAKVMSASALDAVEKGRYLEYDNYNIG